MTDFNVTARFEADASAYLNAVNQARSATEQLGNAADKAGQQTKGAFQGSGQGLKQTSDSATKATTSIKEVGDAAGHTGRHAKSAFEGIGNGIQAANISLDGAAGKYTNLGNRASVALQKAAQGVRNHERELNQVGGAITTIGAGWTALNTTMAYTGIEYNTLQQVATKSMETMMGSIEGANMQMERFHAFADESPFSRATFLEAQRQLMAFGMEAERVVPSLEGIQDAVAAIGGGNAEIMQLVDIFGAIQGQGKITGRELQRMGQMGIDAADIIGEQMGKSGAAIRDEITAGALDADTAIEALTTGMSVRFEGAAAGLKETFEGAIDRVQAAFRDLSGHMFEWAVGSEGGGLFVDLANGAADLMREIEKLPGPILNAIGVISTIGSTATLAAGGFMLLAPRAVEAWDAFVKISNATGATRLLERIRSIGPGAATALRNVGRFAGIAAGALAAIYLAGDIFTDDQIYSVEDMDRAVESLARTGSEASMDRIFSDWATTKGLPGIQHSTDDINSMSDAMAVLGAERTWQDNLNQFVDGLLGWSGAAASGITQVEEKVASFSDSLAGMVNSGDIEGAATAFQVLADSYAANGGEVDELVDIMPSYIDSLINAAAAAGVEIDATEALTWALTGVPPAALEAAGGIDAIGESDGLSKLGEEADAASASIEDVVAKIQVLGQEFRNAFLAEGDMYAAIDNFTQALEENGATLDATTEAGQRNRQALVSMFDASEEYAASILEAGGSTDEAAGAMRTAYDTMVDNAEAMGLTTGEAQDLAAELLNLPDGVDIDTYFDNAAQEMAMALANEIEAIPEHKTIGIAAQEDGSFVSVQQKVDELGNVTATVIVDAEGNVTEVTEEVREINGHEMTVYVDAEGNVYEIEEELRELEKMRPQSTVEVDADTTGAEEKISSVEETDAKATVDTDADTSGAQTALEQFGIMDWSTTVNTDADTSGAETSITGVTAAPWMTTITGLGEMSDAETKANTASRPRTTPFSSSANMSTAESSANTTARQRITPFGSSANMSTAEGAANTTARERFPQFTGLPNVGGAEGSLNTTARTRNAPINATKGADGVSGWLDGLTRARTAVVNVVRRITGAGGYTGGVVGADFGIPKLRGGGRLPYYGLGTDTILGIGSHGYPTALVDDGEWVISEQMSRKYHQALGLINADHPAIQHLAGLNDGGQAGRTRLATTVGGSSMNPTIDVSAPAVDTAAIVDALHSMPLQVTVNADGQAILRVVASAQHQATRGRPAAPIMQQG